MSASWPNLYVKAEVYIKDRRPRLIPNKPTLGAPRNQLAILQWLFYVCFFLRKNIWKKNTINFVEINTKSKSDKTPLYNDACLIYQSILSVWNWLPRVFYVRTPKYTFNFKRKKTTLTWLGLKKMTRFYLNLIQGQIRLVWGYPLYKSYSGPD